ncbi:MAG: haloalkane dehalogenase [Saprospiraceae bacterium]
MIAALTTPEDCFKNLLDYPFTANYLEVGDGLKMHYLDEGNATGSIVLLLHGEPSWSYLYRKMIPIFTEAGFRVIAPDLIGFGKSDKPIQQSDYSYQRHIDWVSALLQQLDLQAINLFCQDWGGLIGLRIAMEQQDRFARIVISNSALPTGNPPMPKAFIDWQTYSKQVPVLPIGKLINKATVSDLSPAVLAAYEAPFPDESYQAGAKVFPSLVPTQLTDPEAINNQKAWAALQQWQKPLLTLFGDQDPITKGAEQFFQKIVPGAQGQAHQIIAGAGHFSQEDQGEQLAQFTIDFIRKK